MISRLLGQLVHRAWALLLAGWALLLLGTWAAAPPWGAVAQAQEFAFLPQSAPSRQAGAMFARAFPDDWLTSNVVLVVQRDSGSAGLDREKRFIEDVLEPGLRRIAAAAGGLASEPVASDEPLFPDEDKPDAPATPAERPIVARIRTPNAPGAGALLVSDDGQALLVVVELTTEFRSARNWPVIARIEELVADVRRQGKAPPGVEIDVTGSAVVGRDLTQAQLRGARATEVLTVVLV